MLLIGTVVSLITAVAATRAMLGLLAGFRWFEDPRFMGAHHRQRGAFLQIDFMRRIAALVRASPASCSLLSVVALGVRGLNLGIDFKGGVQVTFKTPQSESTRPGARRRTGGDRPATDAVVQGGGKSVERRLVQELPDPAQEADAGEQSKLNASLTAEGARARSLGVKNVSASFGRQIARSAILAILVSLR